MRIMGNVFLVLLCLQIFGCGSVIEETNKIAAKFAGSPAAPGTFATPAPVGNIIGTGVWARSTSASPVSSGFNAVAVDAGGNIYAGGFQQLNGTYTYGSQSTAGAATASGNCSIVRYNPDGTTMWAITNSTGLNGCQIMSMAVDSSGNVIWGKSATGGANTSSFNAAAADTDGYAYAVGQQTGTGVFTYSGQTASGAGASPNARIVKHK